MRLSSPSLAEAFIEGARAQGADVVDYGMMATDMMYFAVASAGLEGGAQITASHNPSQYNGIKMVRAEAMPLSGDAGPGRDPRHDPEGHAAGAGGDAGPPDEPRRDGCLRRARVLVHRRGRDQAVQVRPRRRQRHGRPGGAEAVRAAPLPGDPDVHGGGRDASPTTSPTRSSKRTARTSSSASSPRRPTSASPGTATPTAASSSTAPATSSRATSSRRCWPRPSCASGPARPSSTTFAPATPSGTSSRRWAARRS